MKKIIFAVLTLFVLSSCQQQKIGYVDTGKVVNDYQKKKDVEDKYKAKDEIFKKKRDSVGLAFQQEAQSFQAKAQRMSQTKAQQAYEALMQKQQLLQQQFQMEQQELTQGFQIEVDSLISEVKDYVNSYGKTNGYTYILGTSDATSSVLYGAETSDLTQIILDSLNTKYKK